VRQNVYIVLCKKSFKIPKCHQNQSGKGQTIEWPKTRDKNTNKEN